jgi:arylsulfatase A-like enzyme
MCQYHVGALQSNRGTVKKLVIVVGVVVAVGIGAWLALPSILLNYPAVLGVLAELRDPIGPTQTVAWERGPEQAAAAAGERPPNVVVILVDDMGFNDLTWRGGGVAGGAVPTPNIDSLARDGVEFTMGYAGNATCAPSRAAIMTGRYPGRFGFESTPAPAAMAKFVSQFSAEGAESGLPAPRFHEDLLDQVPPMEQQGVPASEITLAELLRDQGYHTLGFGKWHLGDAEGIRPEDQGFDEYLGFYSGGSMFGDPDDPEIVSARVPFDPIDNFVWSVLTFGIRYNGGPRFTPGAYMTDYLSDEAVKAIEANRNRPFFMYLAYNAPHNPLQTTREDYDALSHIKEERTRVYGGMMRSLDRGIGNVLAALRQNGLEENTLVIFSSDNGGAHYIGVPGLNDPYRGWKMTFFEGGMHTPFFVKWPSRIPAGTVSEAPTSHIDVFATVADATGAALPTDRKVDGVSLLPWATGDAAGGPEGEPHEALFWRSGHYQVVQSGGFKLQRNGRIDTPWLYDLKSDPTEQVNLASTHPEKLAELEALLDRQEAELGPPGWPAIVEGAVPVDRTLADPAIDGEEFVYWPN